MNAEWTVRGVECSTWTLPRRSRTGHRGSPSSETSATRTRSYWSSWWRTCRAASWTRSSSSTTGPTTSRTTTRRSATPSWTWSSPFPPSCPTCPASETTRVESLLLLFFIFLLALLPSEFSILILEYLLSKDWLLLLLTWYTCKLFHFHFHIWTAIWNKKNYVEAFPILLNNKYQIRY